MQLKELEVIDSIIESVAKEFPGLPVLDIAMANARANGAYDIYTIEYTGLKLRVCLIDGRLDMLEYFSIESKGKLNIRHRLKGPAIETYRKDGSVHGSTWYHYGRVVAAGEMP